jgi:hypothetical protein
MITDSLPGDRALRAAQVQRHHQPTVGGELGDPRGGNVPRSDGGNDAVVGGVLGPPQAAVTAADRHMGNSTLGQAGTGVLDEVNVDVDRHHSAGLADKLGQQRRVIAAARPDFQHAMARSHIELLKHSGHDRRL